jgi:hypothetical protein
MLVGLREWEMNPSAFGLGEQTYVLLLLTKFLQLCSER